MHAFLRITGIVTAVALACAAAIASIDKPAPAPGAKSTDSLRAALEGRVSAIFAKSCAGSCHGGKYPKAGLDLEKKAIPAALKDIPSRMVDTLLLVDTVRPERSYLLAKIRGAKGIVGSRMPIHRPPLTADEIDVIERWIASLPPAAKPGKKPAGAPAPK